MQKKTLPYKTAGIVLSVLAIAFLCSRYLFQLALVQGDSMEPSFHSYQLILVDKRPRRYENGDVVVFRTEGVQGLLVKRVIAGPGDSVEVRDGILLVNDTVMDSLARIEEPGRASEKLRMQEDCYFVLGDNVNHSIDSRNKEIGNVSQSQIIGSVLCGMK